MHYPVKTLVDLKMGNSFKVSDISGRYLPIALIKNRLGSQDMQEWLCKNPK